MREVAIEVQLWHKT